MADRLVPLALHPLPLGSIRPEGWLKNQLRIQADGLTGHLDEFWPDIADSGWLGGEGEGWERGPYWLDGMVPLAFLLADEKLKEKILRWMDTILSHQSEDGWLGPIRDEKRNFRPNDPWPPTVFLKAATQYYEATEDPRVPAAMEKFFRRLDRLLDRQVLFDWNRMRWQDLALSIQWLLDRTGESWLLDLARRLRRQGFPWLRQTREFPFQKRTETGRWAYESHVVNHGMSIKHPGVCYRMSGDPADRDGARLMIETLDRHHGQASGIFTGDENLAGLNPSQGTELCAVAEYMFSLEVLLSILGDAMFGDRLEQIAFNALPATYKPDMWAHQYDQQANQVVCKVSEDHVYTTNGPHANIFGLEPNFGCCTANMHQGWPKFAAHLWMTSPEEGLAAVTYAPCSLETKLSGDSVAVRVETDYPFSDSVHITVKTERLASFPLSLRVPAWASGAEIRVGKDAPVRPEPGTFHRITRTWSGSTSVVLRFPMALRSERRFNNSIALHRGPLVYSLKLGEDWRLIGGEPPHGDWEVHPATPWNYGLAPDESDLEQSVQVETKPVGDCPFSPDGAPIQLQVEGRRIKGWGLERNAAAPPPASPVTTDAAPETLTLIPYGCTNLRVTEFPMVER